MVFNWENDRENVALGEVANVSSSSSALSSSHVKARHRAPDELRQSLMPMAVVHNSLEEGADAWIDTEHKDNVLVMLNPPDVFA